MVKCNYNSCSLECADGDSYYCLDHRLGWRTFCKSIGILDKQVGESLVYGYKSKFDSGIDGSTGILLI